MRRLVLVALAVGLLPAGAQAATFNVTKVTDTNDHACRATNCSLRDAVIASNAVAGPNTINLEAGHYKLTIAGTNEDAARTGDLDIKKSVTIRGVGAPVTTIDANRIDRAFEVLDGAKLSLSNVTLTNGRAVPEAPGAPAFGGAVYDKAGGSLRFANTAITQNVAAGAGQGDGGAIDMTSGTGSLTLTSTIVSGNRAGGSDSSDRGYGGAIADADLAPISLTHTVVTDNHAGGNGAAGFGGVFDAKSPLSVTDSTISNNTAGGGDGGAGYGGVFDGGGPTAIDTTFRSNHAGGNGGIGYGGVLLGTKISKMTRTVLAGNTAGGLGSGPSGGTAYGFGGAIDSRVTLLDATVAGNIAGGGDGNSYGFGGGVDGPVTAVRTTFIANQAGGAAGWGYGGAVAAKGSATASLTNSTVIFNTAGGGGGEAYGGGIYGQANITLTYSDVVDNTADLVGAGGGGGVYGGALTSRGSIVADNISPIGPNCAQAATSQGHNLENGTSCGFTGTGDLSAEPDLEPVGDNGGPTFTVRLLAGSPAINHGGASGCPATDQRGVKRPQGSSCDIGSYEVAPPRAVTGGATVGRSGHVLLRGTGSNPDAVAGTVFFQFGKTTSYGSGSRRVTLGAQSSRKAFELSVRNLKPGRLYHYRAVARNPDGTRFGADKTFRTRRRG